ncbi:alanine racemase [Kytococcus schroeteri]|uniref:alanine racemase n=1 Tax=Kytococcus schroeteri TaxID=138300 RepID=UPI001142B7BD|nr:alanine racemase [Kytococcus schroeteri]
MDPRAHDTTPWPRLDAATAHLPAPVAAVSLDAVDRNLDRLVEAADGMPLRVASKSIRVRAVVERALAHRGVEGVLAFTLPEAIWLARVGTTDDLLVAYPTVDAAGLDALVCEPDLAAAITLTVDDPAHLAAIAEARARTGGCETVQVVLEADVSLRKGPVTIGPRRSPLHGPQAVERAARRVVAEPGIALRGLLTYEGHVAGVQDVPVAGDLRDRAYRWAVRGMQGVSRRGLYAERQAVVDAVAAVLGHAPELVNGGGTGSVAWSSADPALTEVTVGSGLFVGHLFDRFRAIDLEPAFGIGLDVVRTPEPDMVTLLGSGWVATGAVAADRLPVAAWPPGLELTGTEGAGEVQTPLTGALAARAAGHRLEVGSRVWMRHAKSGEPAERVDEVVLVQEDGSTHTVPTYRGEGKAFL